MNKTEFSYDALLLKINDLRTKIINEDIQKLAQNNSEIRETLKNYKKGNNVSQSLARKSASCYIISAT